jgi:hypothetical protein
MKTILLAALLAVTAGCAAQSATLINDKGERRYCYKSATGAMSNIGAQREFNKCLNEAGSAGFKLEKNE